MNVSLFACTCNTVGGEHCTLYVSERDQKQNVSELFHNHFVFATNVHGNFSHHISATNAKVSSFPFIIILYLHYYVKNNLITCLGFTIIALLFGLVMTDPGGTIAASIADLKNVRNGRSSCAKIQNSLSLSYT